MIAKAFRRKDNTLLVINGGTGSRTGAPKLTSGLQEGRWKLVEELLFTLPKAP